MNKPTRRENQDKLVAFLYKNARGLLAFGTGFDIPCLSEICREYALDLPQPLRSRYKKAWATARRMLIHKGFV